MIQGSNELINDTANICTTHRNKLFEIAVKSIFVDKIKMLSRHCMHAYLDSTFTAAGYVRVTHISIGPTSNEI